jgi:hypothetical protein
MSNAFHSTRSTVDGWVTEILRTKHIDAKGLELSFSGDGVIVYKHPKVRRIVLTEADVYIGEGDNEEAMFSLGYESEAFRDFIDSQKNKRNTIEVKVFSFNRAPLNLRAFRQTQPQYLQ